MMFRVRYMTAPGISQVFCRVDVADRDGVFKAVGTLTLTATEFRALRLAFNATFIDETPKAA